MKASSCFALLPAASCVQRPGAVPVPCSAKSLRMSPRSTGTRYDSGGMRVNRVPPDSDPGGLPTVCGGGQYLAAHAADRAKHQGTSPAAPPPRAGSRGGSGGRRQSRRQPAIRTKRAHRRGRLERHSDRLIKSRPQLAGTIRPGHLEPRIIADTRNVTDRMRTAKSDDTLSTRTKDTADRTGEKPPSPMRTDRCTLGFSAIFRKRHGDDKPLRKRQIQ